jgi:uncharacterized protein RhaS with RHS repeats
VISLPAARFNYNYFRDYDGQTGRYVESDPIGLKAGVNTYGYVAENPIWYGDSRGLDIGQDDDNYCWEGVGIPCVNKKLPPTDRIPIPGPKDPRDSAKGKKVDNAWCARSTPTLEGCNACCARGGLRYGPQWHGQCVAECAWNYTSCPLPRKKPRDLPIIASTMRPSGDS